MKERGFDEMIAYFNRRVSEMDIAQDYKMELLGMVTALGYKHEKTAQQWIPVSERLPEKSNMYTVTDSKGDVVRFVFVRESESSQKYWKRCAVAWMPLPEPYKGGKIMMDLKPCPFCGSEDIYETYSQEYALRTKNPEIFCNTCKAIFAIEDDSPYMNCDEDFKYRREKTAEAWNRRVES